MGIARLLTSRSIDGTAVNNFDYFLSRGGGVNTGEGVHRGDEFAIFDTR